jgi:hypothetical protein
MSDIMTIPDGMNVGNIEELKKQLENAKAENQQQEDVVNNTILEVTNINEDPEAKIPVDVQPVVPQTTPNMDAPKEDIDISDIAEAVMNSEDASYSSVLGNLDDEDNIPSQSIINLYNKQQQQNSIFTSDTDEISSFDTDNQKENTVEDILDKEEVKKENLDYKSYADARKTSNPKLNFMDNITVDLNNITITEKPPLKQMEDRNIIFDSNVSTFFVCCCQSGYSASMSGLTLAEKNAINNSNLDLFQSKQKLYKTVYNKIQSMSIPKPKFDDWLKMTSMGDWATLLFGVYCQTFIDNNDFDITCGNCGKTTSVTVDNQTLVEVKDKNVYAKIEEIIGGYKTAEEVVANAILYKKERIMLNDSKIIIDVKNPTLWDNLYMIRTTNSNTLSEYSDTLSVMLFISDMYMLDVRNTYNTGKATYYKVTERSAILDNLLNLSNADGEQLEDSIENKLGKYNITYEIHNCTCMHCKKKLPNIPVDMETVLFTRINKERKTAQ